jgi:hypothetical protein
VIGPVEEMVAVHQYEAVCSAHALP